jgi:hypothetical protein
MTVGRQPVVVRLTFAQVLRMERIGECLWPTQKLSAAEVSRRLAGPKYPRAWMVNKSVMQARRLREGAIDSCSLVPQPLFTRFHAHLEPVRQTSSPALATAVHPGP